MSIDRQIGIGIGIDIDIFIYLFIKRVSADLTMPEFANPSLEVWI